MVRCDNPNVDYVTAVSTDKKKLFILLLNDINEEMNAELSVDVSKLEGSKRNVGKIMELTSSESLPLQEKLKLQIIGYGMKVLSLDLQP